MTRSRTVKLWVLLVLLLLGGGSAGVFWLMRYRPLDLPAVEADLVVAKRAMQKTARSPESMIAVRQQQERLRLAHEYNAALEANADPETLRRHWDAYRAIDAKARESLEQAAASARLSGGERW